MNNGDAGLVHVRTCTFCGALVEDVYCPSCARPVGAVTQSAAPTARAVAKPVNAIPLTAEERDLLLAASLADHLRAGGYPSTQPVGIRMGELEVGYGSVEAEIYLYSGAEYVEPGSVFLAFGSPLWMLGSLGASAAYDGHRRRKARQEAAQQWRLENRGVLHVTNQRIALQGLNGWLDLYYAHFRSLTPSSMGIVAHFADWPMVCLSCSSPAWTWVILSTMVLGEVPTIEVDEALSAKQAAAGGGF